MKHTKKFAAALMCGTILMTALPLSAVHAEETADTPAASEPVVMDAVVKFNGEAAESSSDKVQIEGTKVIITASGNYEFSGETADGQIDVNIPDKKTDTGTVKLFFNGVKITGKSSAAVLIESAKNTSINIVDGTENFIYDGTTYPEDITAAVYAKDELTIKSAGEAGTGKLRIEAATQHGLHCTEEVKVTGGNLKIRTDKGDGLRGKEAVTIKGGDIDINADGDGLKSTKGKVDISGGKMEIKAGNDAIQAETDLMITGGDIKANGDRGLTAPKGALINGGLVFATATVDTPKEGEAAKDNTFKIAEASTQPVILVQMSEQQLKEQRVVLKDVDSKNVISKNPNKKFDYILLSSPELAVGKTYTLSVNDADCENGKIELNAAVVNVENVVNKAPRVADEGDALDINYDGSVDVSDAVLTCRFVSGDSSVTYITDKMVARMDCDKNGTVEMDDVTVILKRIAHLA
ncbi:MAG: carbohydrate-binding domain-containing protein [Oscillospiraceae bacterium]|nr:carbohydrate-binding domain-containing protein [Oscillospiraceae bacterium]